MLFTRTMWRRSLSASVVLLLSAHTGALAQAWPTKPVRVIVPVTAGSAIDIIARTVSDQLSTQLGQAFVVESAARKRRVRQQVAWLPKAGTFGRAGGLRE